MLRTSQRSLVYGSLGASDHTAFITVCSRGRAETRARPYGRARVRGLRGWPGNGQLRCHVLTDLRRAAAAHPATRAGPGGTGRPGRSRRPVFTAGTQLASVATVVYLLADVRIGAALFGLTLMADKVAGTLAAPTPLRRHGYGRTMPGGVVLGAVPMALVPIAHTPVPTAALTSVALLLESGGPCVTASASVTLRHLLTPSRLHAGMNASYRLVQFAAIPVGAVAAGALADAIGSRPVHWLATGMLLAAAVPLSTAPVRRLGGRPAPASA